nr:MAG TPA: hypothetical protein [Caudoviricetes sp.]
MTGSPPTTEPTERETRSTRIFFSAFEPTCGQPTLPALHT